MELGYTAIACHMRMYLNTCTVLSSGMVLMCDTRGSVKLPLDGTVHVYTYVYV